MFRRARIGSLLFFAGVACAQTTAVTDAVASPLRGEMSGDVKIAALAEAGLAWRASLTAEGVLLTARAPGVELDVLATPMTGALDAWRWRVRRGEIDLGVWWPQLRGLAGEAAAGWSASGRLTLAGEGAWSAATGPTGEVKAALREGWARSDALDVEVSGVELDVATNDLATGALAPGQTLRVGKVSKAGTEVSDIAVEFGLTAARILEVARVEARFLGGRVKLRPFQIAMGTPAISVVAEADDLSIAELAALMPEAVASGSGHVSGALEVSWKQGADVVFKKGSLSLLRSDDARIKLAPQPGFLTSQLPRLYALLSPRLLADLRSLELGKTMLAIDSLEVVFNPDGADGFRTAQVRVQGRPIGRSSVRSVHFDVNLSGDLTKVLMLGLNDQVKIGL